MIYFIALYIFGIFGFLGNLINVRNKVLISYIFFIFLIFSALRVNVGFDYWTYVDLINGVEDSDRIEWISKILINISRYFDEPQIFFVLNSIIFILFMFFALEKFHSLNGASLFVFLTFPLFFLRSLDIVRQYTAMAVVFFASSYLIGEVGWSKRIKYILFSFVGIGFHFPAIFLVFLNLLFSFERIKKFCFKFMDVKKFIIFSAISYWISFYVIEYIASLGFDGYYFSYFENLSDSAGLKIFLFYELFIILFFYLSDKLKINNDQLRFSYAMLFSGGVAYAFLSPYGEHLGRIFAYFLPYFLVCISYVSNRLSGLNKLVMYILLFIVGTFSYYYLIHLRVIDEFGDKLTNVKIFGF